MIFQLKESAEWFRGNSCKDQGWVKAVHTVIVDIYPTTSAASVYGPLEEKV